MGENIIIIPEGNFANKLVALMGAIDLESRINKKINLNTPVNSRSGLSMVCDIAKKTSQ